MLPDWFAPATRAWFEAAFEAPTAAQVGAWRAIHDDLDALVVAPTGSGKTLAAFLSAIDRLMTSVPPAGSEQRCRVVYVSPLKALAVDVERNLRTPLVGISNQLAAAGRALPKIRVAVRTGDTPASDRRSFTKKPPDILITTPESLFLVLTSGAREALRGVDTIILDEVHALAGTKRGAHLALSLERLDALLPKPAQRVALSATVRPAQEVARFVGGAPERHGRRPVEIVRPKSTKVIDVAVKLPVEDLTDLSGPRTYDAGFGPSDALTANKGPGLGSALDLSGASAGAIQGGSIWPHVHQAIVDHLMAHDSTLVFTNSRRAAERLAARVNEEYQARTTGERPDPGSVQPAQIISAAGTAAVAATQIAMAHHGSMSRERRTEIENQLKAGHLPAVIATSSLELGIDMGSIDLVIQVGAPPSAAAGLQRVGRAGHQVGAISQGLVYPVYRGDLVPAAVTAQRMRAGQIESIHVPANPLDVLAQQIVAMVAMDTWTVPDLGRLIRRAAPFENLGERLLESVLDMLSGRYPSADFAELRPRIVWDRATGELTPRPGAAYLARVSGGTIPDRGVYGVYLAGERADPKSSKRVGDLDEEMVYESRVGDTFMLGSSTWRIQDITPNAVYVTPAPGLPGRLPFWKGDSPSRPAELGAAIGEFIRLTAAVAPDQAKAHLASQGLDEWAANNLVDYLIDQREATGQLPDDRTLVVERFPDELGDTRIMIHSVWGGRVNGAWAAVLGARLRDRYGFDAQVMPSDDGIMLRLPELAEDASLDVLISADEVGPAVTAAIAGTAHFAARFRQAAARALVLPRRSPGKRQPLWQQRHRAQQLLQVASQFNDFPVVMEAVRETLQDDFDVPALTELMRAIEQRHVRLVDVQTSSPSPFASAVAFGYTAQFLYDGDAPLAERRAAALSLDPAMLSELLGSGPASDLADLLDPAVVLTADAELSRRVPERQATSAEQLADMLRELGPLSAERLDESTAGPWREWVESLTAARRVIEIRLAGQTRWASVEDAAVLRDGLGVALPAGLPEALLAPSQDPLGALIRRFIRHHGPFEASGLAQEFGLGVAVAERELEVATRQGQCVRGRLRPPEAGGHGGPDYCDPGVVTRLRRRSLAALRQQIEPVPGHALGAFAPDWQQIGRLRGADGVLTAISSLAGAALPASAIESLILPSRVTDYSPGALDELIAAGEVAWVGQGKTAAADGTVRLLALGSEDALLADCEPASAGTLAANLLDLLSGGGAFWPFEMAERLELEPGAADLRAAVWDLVWGGWVTADSFHPLRAFLSGGRTVHKVSRRPPRARSLGHRLTLPPALGASAGLIRGDRGGDSGGPNWVGSVGDSVGPKATGGIDGTGRPDPSLAARWALAPTPAARGQGDPARRVAATALALLERYGVVTRGAAASETTFAQVYPVLSAMEEAGSIRRGYFIEHLGGSQFALPPVPDQLRAAADFSAVLVLAATDPANPYGAALPWPAHPGAHRPGRTGGAIVVLVDGHLVFYLERGGRTAMAFVADQSVLERAAQALANAVAAGQIGALRVARLDGEDALGAHARLAPAAEALVAAGFAVTPSGLVKRGRS
ncbi:MAG: DEAD/DEAH box helicase [Bifidobacteriaceae bacterium]|jgi:ATP-dependent Lhr-like helicase|nr:DEAD/DEAH box helicase [Bifidobacteriaceae bacterium]